MKLMNEIQNFDQNFNTFTIDFEIIEKKAKKKTKTFLDILFLLKII